MIPISCKERPCPRCEALEKRLAQASGALGEMSILLTSCVGKDDDAKKLMTIISAAHRMILGSADRVRTRPSWFRHDWEGQDWDDYEDGKIQACSYERPAIDVAKELMEASREGQE